MKAIALGALQGLTEFLPVSSSGHLVIAQHLLGVGEGQVAFDVAVHLGTLAAVLIVFRKEILSMVLGVAGRDRLGLRRVWLVVVGSIPAGVVGVLFKDTLEGLFSSVLAAALGLIFTGAWLMLTRWIPPGRRGPAETGAGRALWVGIMQALAIIPGVSRSGTTIGAGLVAGLERGWAGAFSFLLAIPAITGASLLEVRAIARVELAPVLAGALTAAVVGWAALKVLMGVVKAGRLHVFAWYCWALAAIGIWIALGG